MGQLRGADGEWLESEDDKLDRLVGDLFGRDAATGAGNTNGLVEYPYGEEEVMWWVRNTLSGTKNNSTAGPDSVGYKLIKAVWDRKLGIEVLGESVAALRGGHILDRWRERRVVWILKPGWDLTQTKNWRPLNLINYDGKVGEKVVTDRIQEEGESVLHLQQFDWVCGRSALDVLYKLVMEARKCLENMGSVGWALWDVKGGFQKVRNTEALARLAGCGPLRC